MYDLFQNSDGADWFETWASIAAHHPFNSTSSVSSEAFADLFPRPYDGDLEDPFTGWTPEPDLAGLGKAVPASQILASNGGGAVTDVGEVIITGPRTMSIDEINQILADFDEGFGAGGDGVYSGGGGGSYGGDGAAIYSGGGGVDQPLPDRPSDPGEDGEADTLADQVEDEIMPMGDSDRVEYPPLVWRGDQGNLHLTAPLLLTETFPADPGVLRLDSHRQVVSPVHSQPSQVNLNDEWVDANHGWVHGGDWASARLLVNTQGLDENNFTMYVVYNGQVREYGWKDNSEDIAGMNAWLEPMPVFRTTYSGVAAMPNG